MPLALVALTLSTFGIGTTEFVIMGLLSDVADDLSISVSGAGYLISGYALGVVIGGPLLVSAGIRLPRKAVLLGLMGIFIAGNLLSALSPGYEVLMAGRIVTATCHGSFIGLASVVAADLVETSKKARAVSMVFAGGAIANVVGAPLGTWVGQHSGWRATFWMLVVIGAIGFVGIMVLLPPQRAAQTTGLRQEIAVFRRPQVLIALAMTAFSLGALFTSFTYVAPMLTEVTGYASTAIAPLLVLFGAGLVAGNTIGGRFADRALLPTLGVALAALTLTLALFSVTAHGKVPAAITLVLMGAAGFATVPGLMTRVISKAEGAPTLAAVVTVSASNIGIAAGAYLGGLTIDAGYGYTSPNWIGALLAAAALALTLLSGALEKKPAPRDTTEGAATESAAVRPGTSG
ncbi:MFS transporter [Streptomyces sudanensis]|uniref:MFS transporter n=1 Tax=Streptomyces sudanensis TaxID=436397 RepID=UPI0020CD63D0|nr:MFS transporter [Streptomyces sudanensis]MCP9958673.1 MFS transporter [Streptomyces sudanensis]MCQ0000832.1 MFS transporter [Streptomyces sudanensis]